MNTVHVAEKNTVGEIYGNTNFDDCPYLSCCRTVIGHTRKLDPTRPVTFVSASDYNSDKAVSEDSRGMAASISHTGTPPVGRVRQIK